MNNGYWKKHGHGSGQRKHSFANDIQSRPIYLVYMLLGSLEAVGVLAALVLISVRSIYEDR